MSDTKKSTPPTPPHFTRDELLLINNALNEVCNGVAIDDEEFQTRLGFSRARARELLKKVARTLE